MQVRAVPPGACELRDSHSGSLHICAISSRSVPGATNIDVRMAHDRELERVFRLRWLWDSEGGRDVGSESEFVVPAAAWAREHRGETSPPRRGRCARRGRRDGVVGPDAARGVGEQLDRWSGDLQSCYVVPELTNAGVGGLLVEAVLTTARARGIEHVTVHASPEAAWTYARNGFSASSRLLWADGAFGER